jgi:hypothetical protein
MKNGFPIWWRMQYQAAGRMLGLCGSHYSPIHIPRTLAILYTYLPSCTSQFLTQLGAFVPAISSFGKSHLPSFPCSFIFHAPFTCFFFSFFFYYSYVHTRLGSFLPPAPTPSLTIYLLTHSQQSVLPHFYSETFSVLSQ